MSLADGVVLVIGGARSGKSRFAQAMAEATAPDRIYLATATFDEADAEMADRIERHRADRGAGWRTVEEPLALAAALQRLASPDTVILVDCLTLWLSNLMLGQHDVATETQALCAVLPELEGPVVLVSNEVGMGIVPDHPLGRRFRDEAGRANQQAAVAADRVYAVIAGLPLLLKPSVLVPGSDKCR